MHGPAMGTTYPNKLPEAIDDPLVHHHDIQKAYPEAILARSTHLLQLTELTSSLLGRLYYNTPTNG